MDAEGYIDITDRAKDLIKSGREGISSVDVESALMDHPAVQEAGFIAVPHPEWDERPVAVVVLRPGTGRWPSPPGPADPSRKETMASRVRQLRTRALSVQVILALAALPGGCGDATGPGADDRVAPAGPDVTQPFPIDRGDDAGTPGTYKALWLRLADNSEPAVTAVGGVIGVVCVGMSNANQECTDFIQRIRGEWSGAVNPAVRVVNCAVGGHAIERWNDPSFDATLWDDCIARKLGQGGVRADQVRVLWHKAANQFTTAPGGGAKPAYPAAGSDYQAFLANLGTFASRVRTKFPSVQAVYTSSRSYGGFAGSAGRGEPLSYEEGHALNTWLRQNREVEGVWYGWGPYLWAPDCASGVSNAGGVCYVRADYVADGVHPSATGEAKVSGLLHAWLGRHGWYRR